MALRTKPFYPIKGVNTVIRNLNHAIGKIENRSKAGLVRAAFDPILRDAKIYCPRDLGNLWNSGYVLWHSSGLSTAQFAAGLEKMDFIGPNAARLASERQQIMSASKAELAQAAAKHEFIVEIGFTPYYAIYVHEDAEAIHPTGQYKFLQRSLEQNKGKILQIVANEARI